MLDPATYENGDPVFRTPGYWRGRKAATRLANASIPPKFADRRLDALAAAQDGVRRLVERWDELTSSGPIVRIIGPRQTGKTFCGSVLLHELVVDETVRRSGYFTTTDALRRMYTETAQNDGRLGSDWPDPFLLTHCRSGFDVLVIDDFGREPTNENRTAALATLLAARQADGLPTVVLIDLTLDSKEAFMAKYESDYLADLVMPEPGPYDDPERPRGIRIKLGIPGAQPRETPERKPRARGYEVR
jgi:hypothetical protein